jgi:hypothetical protein
LAHDHLEQARLIPVSWMHSVIVAEKKSFGETPIWHSVRYIHTA